MAKSLVKLTLNILKYLLSLGVAAFLLWYVYRDLDVHTMLSRFLEVNYNWIFLSMTMALLSHYLRAYRWNILLEPLGYKLKTHRTFLAVMVGYFANMLVPRMGEVTRCGILKKNDDVALAGSFGSVVAERVFDLIVLISLIIFAFFVEFNRLSEFLTEFFKGKLEGFNKNFAAIFFLAIAAGILIISVFIVLRVFREKVKRVPLVMKIRKLIYDLIQGILSIRKIKNKTGFWVSTILIWLLYYLMAYVVFFSIPETSKLGLLAGLSVLIMGGIGMSTPVQGGIGPYHLLVSGVLVLYGISADDGKFFAFLMHTSQFVMVIVVGAICYIISIFLKKEKQHVNSTKDTEVASIAKVG